MRVKKQKTPLYDFGLSCLNSLHKQLVMAIKSLFDKSLNRYADGTMFNINGVYLLGTDPQEEVIILHKKKDEKYYIETQIVGEYETQQICLDDIVSVEDLLQIILFMEKDSQKKTKQ